MIQSYHNCFRAIVITFLLFFTCARASHDVTIIGQIDDSVSIAHHTFSFVSCLHDSVSIQLVKSSPCKFDDIPQHMTKLAEQGIDLPTYIDGYDNRADKVTIFADRLYAPWFDKFAALPRRGIRLAYLVAESTKLYQEWVAKINKSFDALVVADNFLVEVCKSSGVQIPIFVLPLSLDLSQFLTNASNKKNHQPLIFGCSAAFYDNERKNHALLMDAFVQEFGNNPNVQLKLHGRLTVSGSEQYFDYLCSRLEQYDVSNIELKKVTMSQNDYVDFIKSLDCYILISRAEGFSITPRQALAAGIPCIITDNTAQTTICNSGFVCSVPAHIMRPAYSLKTQSFFGFEFDCNVSDVRKALRDVYSNYLKYCELAEQGRVWAGQYCVENLKNTYINLVKPKKLLLGDKNIVTGEYLMTDSQELYNKYKNIVSTQ